MRERFDEPTGHILNVFPKTVSKLVVDKYRFNYKTFLATAWHMHLICWTTAFNEWRPMYACRRM